MVELDVDPGGRIDGQFTFASAEPLGDTPLREEDLRDFLLAGVDVTADGARCEPSYGGSGVAETDALVLQASYACPAHAGEITLTLYYLNRLRPGHREVARIVAQGASAEALLTSDRRALSLRLPGASDVRARTGRRLILLSAAFTAFLLSLLAWRAWATRRRPPGGVRTS